MRSRGRGSARRRVAAPVGDLPVFLDESGARWRLVKRVTILAIVVAAAAVAWVLPRALVPDPGDDPTVRRADTSLLDSLHQRLPVIGDGVMLRVFRVDFDGSRPYATEPFTGERLRELSQTEMQEIGYSPYAVERFGQLPDKQLALTFDDGPDPRNTPALLDLLSRYGARATFFDTGDNVLRHPELFERTVREGHLVGNHTMKHVEFSDHGSTRNLEEIVTTDRVMRSVGGYGSTFFRLPYGGNDTRSIAEDAYGILLAQQTGHLAASFDVDTDDYLYQGRQAVPVPKLDGRGHVLLLHDGGGDHRPTIQLVEKLLQQAKAQGYTFVTMQSLHPQGAAAAGPRPVSVTDRLTHWALYGAHILPALLVKILFVLGAGTMAVVSVLTVVLAVVAQRRRKRRRWLPGYRPAVTVVIAAYNEAAVIRKTLSSLRHSRYRNFEVLVVDDGSTDGTADVVREVALEWAGQGGGQGGQWAPGGLRVVSQSNGGKPAALNRALAEVRSDVVVTFDADTVVLPDTVGTLVRHFADPRVGAVAGVVKVGNRRGVLTRWQSLEYLTAIGLDRSAQSLLGAIMIVPGACAAWRRAAVLEVGGFDKRTLAEDCDLTLSLQRARWRVTQELDAVAYTEVPQSTRSLVRQRFRWTFGSLQAICKQRRMLLRPRHGVLGLVVMPYALLSIAVPLLFMPVAYGLVVQSVLAGDMRRVLLYLGLLTAFHLLVATVAVVMMRERWWHLLVVPIYRLIYEPLRTYLLYATALAVLRGRMVGWNKLHRTGTVRLAEEPPLPRALPQPVPVPVQSADAAEPAPAPQAVVQRVRAVIPAARRSTSRS